MLFLLSMENSSVRTGKEDWRTILRLSSVKCKENRGRFVFNSYKALPGFRFLGLNCRNGQNALSRLLVVCSVSLLHVYPSSVSQSSWAAGLKCNLLVPFSIEIVLMTLPYHTMDSSIAWSFFAQKEVKDLKLGTSAEIMNTLFTKLSNRKSLL